MTMNNELAFILALLGVAVLVAAVAMLPGGCKGDCEQGREPCNCDEENITPPKDSVQGG